LSEMRHRERKEREAVRMQKLMLVERERQKSIQEMIRRERQEDIETRMKAMQERRKVVSSVNNYTNKVVRDILKEMERPVVKEEEFQAQKEFIDRLHKQELQEKRKLGNLYMQESLYRARGPSAYRKAEARQDRPEEEPALDDEDEG
jgi:hypothetical protein